MCVSVCVCVCVRSKAGVSVCVCVVSRAGVHRRRVHLLHYSVRTPRIIPIAF